MGNGNNRPNPPRATERGSSLLDLEETLGDAESLSVKAHPDVLGLDAGGPGEAELLVVNLLGCKNLVQAPSSSGHATLRRSRLGRNGVDVQMWSCS